MSLFKSLQLSLRAIIAVLVSFTLLFTNVAQANAAGAIAQTISWTTTPPAPMFAGDPEYAPAGATSTSGLAVTYGVTNSAGVCSWNSTTSKITLDGVGNCTVTVNQAGDATYAAATQITKTFYVMPATQKQLNGLTVCFTAPWTHCEINGLSYGWDYATGKYTTFAKAGETATVLTNQSSGATQLNGTSSAAPVSGTATGYYTNTSGATESLNCSISVTGTGSHSVTIGSTSLSVSATNGSSSSSRSGSIAAGATVAVSSVFSWTSNDGQPVRWVVPCTVNGRNFTTDSFSSVIRPVISTVTPFTGLLAGGNNIVITGSNFGTSGATVKIGGVTCPVVGATTSTTITCTVPASQTSQLVDITVTSADGAMGTKVGAYSYEATTYPVPTNSAAPVASTTASTPIPIGSSIVSTLGTWNMNGDPTTTTTVKWQVCSTAQALLCTDISGATGTPWTATADVAGKYVRSVVTATNNGGSTTANSNILGVFGKASQTITFTSAIASKSVGVTDFYPAINYSPASPLRIATLTSTTTSVCTIVDNKIHIVAQGTCGITANMPADDTFNAAAPISTTFTVVAPTFTGGTSLTPAWNTAYSYQFVYSNPNAVFSITSGSLPAGLAMSASGLITGTTLEQPLVTSYPLTISATDAGGTQTLNTTLTIAKGTLKIVSSGVHDFVRGNDGNLYAVVDTASNPGAIVQNGTQPIVPIGQDVGWWGWSSQTPTVCTVAHNGLVTVLKQGACYVQIDTTDSPLYSSKTIVFSDIWRQNVTPPAPKKANTINFAGPTAKLTSSADFTVAPTATSGAVPTLTSSTTSVCTVSGLTVHIVSAGTCTLSAAGAGNATYNAAPAVSRSFEVVVGPDRPTITDATVTGALGGSALVTFTEGDLKGWTATGHKVTANPAAGAFGFPSTVTCPSVGVACEVTGLTPGVSYTFVATTLASSNGLNAQVDSDPSSPVLVRLPQEILLVSPGVKRPDAGSFPLFPISDIGAVVVPVVTSSTPSICTVDSNNVVTIVAAGTCTLTATSPSVTARGINYGAATPVSLSFPVSATAPAVTTALPLASMTVGVSGSIVNTAVAGSVTVPIPTTVAGTWTATGLPAGLVIDSKTGKITGTPKAPGVYDQILVTVKDKAGVTASKPLTLTVVAGPGIVGPTVVAVVSGQPATVDDLAAVPGTASIPSTGAWAVTSGALPAGLTLNPDTGVVSGTPTGVVGKVTVTITLTDSAPLTASKVLTFDVAVAPTFQTPSVTMSMVQGQKIAVAINPAAAPDFTAGTAGKPAKGAWSFEPKAPSTQLPDGISFNFDTGLITGAPLVAGHYEFDAVFTDAKGLQARKTYIFNVAEPPFITTAVMLPVYTVPASGTPPVFSVDLEGDQGTNSIPGTAAWSVVAPTLLPAGLTLNADTGVISGTPPTGLTKDYTFKIKLVDSAGLTSEKTFTLPVIKAGVNKTTLNLPAEIAGGTLFTDELYDLDGDTTANPVLAATGASSMSLPVTYSVTATSVATCYIDADKMLHIIGAGVCGVTATSGTVAAKNVSAATQSFVVSKRSQVLTVTAPGETIPGSNPSATAPAATDDPAGFRIAVNLSSGLDPVYTVIPEKNPNGTDKDPNCAVDDTGNVTWLYDMTLTSTQPGYDANGGKCRVAISHAGNSNYGPVVTQYLDLAVAHVTPSAPSDDDNVEPGVSMGLPRTGGTAYKGGVGFNVKVTPTGVTVQPISKGLYIGPITANISIEYKVNNVVQTQTCTTSFGIALKDKSGKVITNPALETKGAIYAITKPYRAMPKGGPKGYLAGKSFTNSVTCALNKDAVAFFKAGGQLKANAEVIRDRRWPTTYKPFKPNGEVIAPRTVNWVLKVG